MENSELDDIEEILLVTREFWLELQAFQDQSWSLLEDTIEFEHESWVFDYVCGNIDQLPQNILESCKFKK